MKYLFFLFAFCQTTLSLAQGLQIQHLRCEYKVNPIGIEEEKPQLSWHIISNQRNTLQKAYQILVAEDSIALQKNKGTSWDSGIVRSDASILVPYQGKALLPSQKYYWKVRIWDNHQRTSAWSTIASWQMGLPKAQDWFGAKWITDQTLTDSLVNSLPTDGKKDKVLFNKSLPLFRKTFQNDRKIAQATIFIAGLGHFEAYLNGKKIGNNFLEAGWTKYDKEALYVGYDVTTLLQKGNNALGVMLGNGFYHIPAVKERYRKLKVMYGFPKMICRLKILYTDGSEQNIVSDETWKTSPSPITFSSIYGGEDYNALLEQPNWHRSSFDDKHWDAVKIVAGVPQLRIQMAEPLQVKETFEPTSKKQLPNKEWVYDFGQNASGIVAIRVQGHKGDTIKIRPAELINADGSVNQKASGSPYYFTYILKGEGIESWQARFSYYGFRYVQVKGATPVSVSEPNPLQKTILHNITMLHTRNAADTIGQFRSSSALFNRTHTLIDWAIKSNMASVFTDCPHREKLGWLEELHLMGASVRYRFDTPNLFKKAISDMQASQLANGLVPEISPEYVKFEWGGDMFRDSPEWGSSSILVPWYVYQWYGDSRPLQKAYPMMQAYLTYLASKAKNHILTQGLGDWYDLGPNKPGVSQLTPMGVTGTAIYYHDLMLMTDIAKKLGFSQDAASYSQIAQQVKKSFNETFYHPENQQYASGSQAANAMALYMNLVEPQNRKAVLENLIQDIRKHQNGLTAGDIGYRYVLRVLEMEGRSDVIFDMNSRSDVAGYGYQLAQGATALTESWQALPSVSNNHFMLGHLMEWFYSGLAGIKQDEQATAFKKIIIAPQLVGNIKHAQANYLSPYGLIKTAWQIDDKRFTINIEIPANTQATIVLPKTAKQQVYESKQKFTAFQENTKGIACTVGSGKYHFEIY